MQQGRLAVAIMGRGMAWQDSGTQESLLEAGRFGQTLKMCRGLEAACPEEVADRMRGIAAWLEAPTA